MTSSTIEFSRSSMKESSSSSKSDVTKEVKKPAWLQELSNKQASRNSEVFESSATAAAGSGSSSFSRTLEKTTTTGKASAAAAAAPRPLSQPPAVQPQQQQPPPPIASEKPCIPTKPSQIDHPKPGRTSEPVATSGVKPSQLFLDGKPGRISEPTKGSFSETLPSVQKPTTPDNKPEFLRPKPATIVSASASAADTAPPSKVQLAKQSLNNQLNNNNSSGGGGGGGAGSELLTDSNDNPASSTKADTAAISSSTFGQPTSPVAPASTGVAATDDHQHFNRKKSFSEIRNEINSAGGIDSYSKPSEVRLTDKSPSSPAANVDVVLKVRAG